MDDLIKIDEKLYVFTRAPNEADLDELSSSGIQSVVSLRAAGENGEVLSPDAEGDAARKSGLSYRNLPVAPSALNIKTACIVGAELEELPGPVAIHCASGKRASLMALSHWARQHHASAREAAEKAEGAGLKVTEAELQPLVDQGTSS